MKGLNANIEKDALENNIINVSETEDLKLYTIYSPAHHKDGVVRATKEEAETNGPEFDGKTTE